MRQVFMDVALGFVAGAAILAAYGGIWMVKLLTSPAPAFVLARF